MIVNSSGKSEVRLLIVGHKIKETDNEEGCDGFGMYMDYCF